MTKAAQGAETFETPTGLPVEQADRSSKIESLVAEAGDDERVQAAVVIWGRGDLDRIRNAQALALLDWRDILVRAELASDDWPPQAGR